MDKDARECPNCQLTLIVDTDATEVLCPDCNNLG